MPPVLKPNACAPLLALALSACATLEPAKTPVQVEPPKLAPPPASVMVQRQPSFQERLRTFFSASPEKPTK